MSACQQSEDFSRAIPMMPRLFDRAAAVDSTAVDDHRMQQVDPQTRLFWTGTCGAVAKFLVSGPACGMNFERSKRRGNSKRLSSFTSNSSDFGGVVHTQHLAHHLHFLQVKVKTLELESEDWRELDKPDALTGNSSGQEWCVPWHGQHSLTGIDPPALPVARTKQYAQGAYS